LQLAPDCKIYGLGGGDTRFYHIIHHPDNPGTNCNVELNGLKLTTPSGASIPSFPNYRLGPLENPGLPCSPVVSTSTVVASPLPVVSVFPNPAREYVKITVNQPDSGTLHWILSDLYGRPVRTAVLHPQENDWQQVALSGLSEGVYFWAARAAGGVLVRSGKLMIAKE